jgi:hypothetical protein
LRQAENVTLFAEYTGDTPLVRKLLIPTPDLLDYTLGEFWNERCIASHTANDCTIGYGCVHHESRYIVGPITIKFEHIKHDFDFGIFTMTFQVEQRNFLGRMTQKQQKNAKKRKI